VPKHRPAHYLAVSERRGFREGKDPIGKPVAPCGQALFAACRSLTRANLAIPESYLGNHHDRQRQFDIVAHEPCDHRGIRGFAQGLGENIDVKEDQNSGPELVFPPLQIAAFRPMSSPQAVERRA
jgi:hypothetical protein